jgi:microsomal epoxide hydrolase
MLTNLETAGGDLTDSFDIVVPSLPGFGFSDRPRVRGFTKANVNEGWVKLMSELGYGRFGTVGGDTGSPVAQLLGHTHPEKVVGIHLTDIGWHNTTAGYPDLSPDEKQYLGAIQGWLFQEGAYALLQSTKPQTLGNALNDSPVGLASWILEKFWGWSDCNGNVESKFTKDELLTNIMIYWTTQTITSSIRTYFEEYRHPALVPGQRIEVPVAMALFPKDPPQVPIPRSFAERCLRIKRWTEMPRGGHFAAMEEPELLAGDIRAFFESLTRT